MRSGEISVERARCIGCSGCRTLAPSIFELRSGSSRAARQATNAERSVVEASRLICPTDAIRALLGPTDVACDEAAPTPTYAELSTTAEAARRTNGELAWDGLQPGHATPELRAVVREMAFSESATYSATQRFLEAFFDDLELSKWISVWFYEETRHPHVLVEWLRRVGEPVTSAFEVEGRVSTPFMRSAVGTLVSNVISEVTAAQAYRGLAARSPEPVLAGIARKIAGDEARHAATFFRFARARLRAEPPEARRREEARALEVLQAWLGGAQPTTHPVAQMLERLDEAANDASLGLDFTSVQTRVVRVVGLLVGLPLARRDDVGPALRSLLLRRERS